MAKSGAWWEGTNDLKRELESLTRGMQGAALRSALRAGGTVLRDAAKKSTPSRRVKKALTVVASGRGPVAVVRVGGKKGEPGTRIFHLVEEDTRPHTIQPKKKRGKRVLAGRGRVFGRTVRHPGTRGRKQFKKLIESHRAEVERKTVSALRQIIARMRLRMLRKQR